MFYNRKLGQSLGLDFVDNSEAFNFERVYETFDEGKDDGFSKLDDTLSVGVLLNSGK
jgi:hypothetical protein